MSMFYNGTQCDLYIGKGSGKKLLQDIRNANESVRIVSPYLSPSLVSELININNYGVKVELITTDKIEDYKTERKKNIKKLIIQNKRTDQEAQIKRNKWKKIRQYLLGILALFILSIIALYFLLEDWRVVYGFLPITVIFIIALFLKTKIKNKRIYSYYYSQLFPFKVYMSPYESALSDTLIHAKIYIIDNRIVYLGSINFTVNATSNNYETRIRITDINAVKKINAEFVELYDNAEIPFLDIQFLGKQIYSEPIN